jgi:[ribosomal protein S5]-alanine N-acetyltransferase
MPLHFTLSQLTHQTQTPRLLLRQPQVGDAADLFEIHRDETVHRFLPHPAWQSIADSDVWFERAESRLQDNSCLHLVVVAKDVQRVIGDFVLFRFDVENEIAEIGYAMGQAWWGQGFAMEAIQAVIDYAFVVLGIRRLVAHVDVTNQASNRLLLKAGFTHEGVLREDQYIKGELTSANMYGLLRRDWEK